MNAEAIRKRLDAADLEELCALASRGERMHVRLTEVIGHLAEAYDGDWQRVIDCAPHASRIAESLIASASHSQREDENIHREGFVGFSDAVSSDALTAAQALAAFDDSEAFLDPYIAGSLTRKEHASPSPQHLADGSLVSKALAVALAESLESERVESRDRLKRLQPLMADMGSVVRDEWYKLLHEHLPHTASRARLTGHSLASSRARACVEGVCRTGKAFQDSQSSELIFALGATGLDVVSETKESLGKMPYASIVGAIAMGATYGFPVGWQDAKEGVRATLEPADPLQNFDRYDSSHQFLFVAHGLIPLRFSWGELEPLALLTIDAACDKLERMALSPRLPEWVVKRYSILATSVRDASRDFPERTSFARALGIQETSPTESTLIDGDRLYPAAPVGRRPASLVVRGRANREMRLHAVANKKGHLAGYVGLDPLSEEFHGFPERYVYDLDGWRQGRFVDGIYRKGRSPMKMMTAPEGIDLSRHHSPLR